MYFHFDCNFNYYCPSGYASMYYDGVNFHTQVSGYETETKSANVAFNISAGQESARYGDNYYNPHLGNSRQRTVDVHAWISNGLFTGGGWTTVASPTIGDPSNLQISISSVSENSCVVTHNFTNNRNYWYVRLWDRNTRTYYNLNNNTGSGTTTITGLNPNQTYAFELWACGRDGNEYGGSHPGQTITTLGKSSIGNSPSYTIGSSFVLNISGYSDSFTHTATFTIGGYSFSKSNLRRGNVTIVPTAAENDAMYAQMTTVLSRGMTISLTTYVNGTSIGSNSGSGTVSINTGINTPTVNSFVYKDVNALSIALTGNDQYVLQNVSKLQISGINATMKNKASLSKFRLEVSGATYENTATTINTNTITSNTQMSVKAIDSRGLQGGLNKSFALFVPYSVPNVSEFTLLRTNGIETEATLTLKGSYSLISINNVNKNSIISIKYRYKATTSTTWSDLKAITPVISSTSFSFKNIIGNFDVDTSYDFEAHITDKITTKIEKTILVVGKPSLSIRKSSIGINKVPTAGVALDVEGTSVTQGTVESGTYFIAPNNQGLRSRCGTNGAIVELLFGINGNATTNVPLQVNNLITTNSNGVSGTIGAQNSGFYHFITSGPAFYMNKKLHVCGDIYGGSDYYRRLAYTDETPTFTSGNGWNVFRFPSGLMIQTGIFNANPTFNEKSGSINYGRFPAVANFPINFITEPTVSLSVEKGYSEVFASPAAYTTVSNAFGGLQVYVGTGVAYGQGYSVYLHVIAIGRYK